MNLEQNLGAAKTCCITDNMGSLLKFSFTTDTMCKAAEHVV